MSSTVNHVPVQHVSNSTTGEILPPDAKRRRLNGSLQHGKEHSNQYGLTTLNDSSCAIMGNVYETHNHFTPPSPRYPQTEEAKLKCLRDSLAFKRMDARLHNVKTALKNTCEWLFRHRTFKEWIDDTRLAEHKGFLWIKGKPGCGKSTLMKGAYHWAKTKAKKRWITLSYFFNARAPGVLEKSPLGLYRLLVHEILCANPASVDVFDEMFSWKDPSDDAAWTIEELQEFLVRFIESDNRPSVIILIDALDEGDERDIRALISFLEDLIAHSHEGLPLRICLSSRHYPHITIRTGLSLIVEDQTEHDRDIEKYVCEKLLHDAHPETSSLRATTCERSNGIFLWVVLVVPILNHIHDQGKSVADMEAYLKRLPEDLEGLFAEILARDAVELRSCVSLLQWVLYSTTALNTIELYLAIQHSWYRPDEDIITVPTQDVLAKYILHHSRGLVEVTKTEPPVVQFIHETVREFLVGDHGLAQVDPALAGNLPGWTHAKLTQACLSYFSRNCSQSTLSSYWQQFTKFKTKAERGAQIRQWIPFLPYVTANLLLHAEAAQRHGIPQGALLDTLQTSNGQPDPNFLFACNFCQEHQVRHYKPGVTILYVAAEQGLPALTSLILASGNHAVNTSCGRYGNALQAACHNGNEEIVRSLLEFNADVNAVGGEYKTALGAAMAARHFHLFELLRKYGLKMPGVRSTRALDWIGRPSSTADVRELFRLEIGPYLPQVYLHAGLVIATKSLNIEVMKLLLQNGADVNFLPAEARDSPLIVAIEKGSREAVNLLVSRGAHVNTLNQYPVNPATYYSPALLAASEHGREEIVQTLIDAGAEIDGQVGYNAESALYAASRWGHEPVVQMLLDRGANINAQKELSKESALYEASRLGREQVVQTLINRGANVNAIGGEFGSPLAVASQYGNKEVVQILLDNGADVNAQAHDVTGVNSLYSASHLGWDQIVQMLLDRGADVNVETGSLGNALVAASSAGHEKVVQILLKNGADVNAQGGNFDAMNPLYAASSGVHEHVVQVLLDRGANVNAITGSFGTALNAASAGGHEKIVQMLLDRGADINARGIGSSPLEWATLYKHDGIVQILLAAGATENYWTQ